MLPSSGGDGCMSVVAVCAVRRLKGMKESRVAGTEVSRLAGLEVGAGLEHTCESVSVPPQYLDAQAASQQL